MPQAPDLSRLLDQALTHQRQLRPAQAERIYERILAEDPGQVDALHLLGLVRQSQGRAGEALALIEAALAVKPDFAVAHTNRGNLLQELGRCDEALASHDRALALNPGDGAALASRGTALRALGRHDEALASYRRALAARPDNATTYNNLGNALKDLGRFEDALASYRQALALKPNYPNALLNLGGTLLELRRNSEALAYYDKALLLQANHADALNGRGLALMALDRRAEALASFAGALTLEPSHVEARINHGFALLEGGKLAQASAEADTAARLADAPSFPHYMLGLLLARCGREEAARTHLAASLARDQKDGRGARMVLASLGFAPPPERAPEALIERIYAAHAFWWDEPASPAHRYHGAELVAAALDRLGGPLDRLSILDAGCGTGSIGGLLGRRARRLVGVDLSAPMLAKARAKAIYDELHQRDLVAFMGDSPDVYDVIVCAATLIHFGDLRPAFAAAHDALREGGRFIFTLLANPLHDEVAVAPLDGLATAGCFVHGRAYVRRLAAQWGFDVDMLEDAIHEYSARGEPRTGLVVALRCRQREAG